MSDSQSGLLAGGCCAGSTDADALGPRERRARALAGLAFLLLAGAMGTRRLPGRIALWPASLVPTWFGISHLVAGVIGLRGCPELAAIPSVLLDRRVETSCETWERLDRRLRRYEDGSPVTCSTTKPERDPSCSRMLDQPSRLK